MMKPKRLTLALFMDKVIKEGKWEVTKNANDMPIHIIDHIKRGLKRFLEDLKETQSQINKVGGGEDLQTMIKAKIS